MIQPIMKDVLFLTQKSEPAKRSDRQAAVDLLDTLKAHSEECVGMAANMIGIKKNINSSKHRKPEYSLCLIQEL